MLGIVCMVIVTMGYIFMGIPVSVICIADAMVKLICGIYLLFTQTSHIDLAYAP